LYGYLLAAKLAEPSGTQVYSRGANRVWTGDITYVWTEEGWLYLAVVIDLFGVKLACDSSGQARRASGPLAFFQASMPP
jgi:transposase InsO family protein